LYLSGAFAASAGGNVTDERKDLGGWKSRVMVDRYAKFVTEHLGSRPTASGGLGGNVVQFPTFSLRSETKRAST
jgi:hypothetical protein